MDRFKHRNTILSRQIFLSVEPETTLGLTVMIGHETLLKKAQNRFLTVAAQNRH
jgi:hypothetical protein